MLGYVACLCSLLAMSLTMGWIPLPTGPWPGISLGLAALGAGVLELRRGPNRRDVKVLAWIGVVVGLLSALLGIAIYVGLVLVARRL